MPCRCPALRPVAVDGGWRLAAVGNQGGNPWPARRCREMKEARRASRCCRTATPKWLCSRPKSIWECVRASAGLIYASGRPVMPTRVVCPSSDPRRETFRGSPGQHVADAVRRRPAGAARGISARADRRALASARAKKPAALRPVARLASIVRNGGGARIHFCISAFRHASIINARLIINFLNVKSEEKRPVADSAKIMLSTSNRATRGRSATNAMRRRRDMSVSGRKISGIFFGGKAALESVRKWLFCRKRNIVCHLNIVLYCCR